MTKATSADERDRRRGRAPASPLSGTGAKLIARISAPTSTTERMPPRLSTGSVVSLTWRGHEAPAPCTSATTASGSVTRKTEPHQKCSSRAPATSGPSAAIAPPIADHSAIDLRPARARPQRGDQRQRRRVGHAGREAAERPGRRRARRRTGAYAASRQAGIDSAMPEQQHQLAAVAVAERAEVEHRGGEPERVADRDQVERRLRGVEAPCRCRAARRWRPRG